MGFEGPVGKSRKWVDRPDVLQNLIDEWWELIPEGVNKDGFKVRGPIHTDRRPKARRNLCWWVEAWMGDDLINIEHVSGYDDEGKKYDPPDWTYTIGGGLLPGRGNYAHTDRAVALFSAAIALAKRRYHG